MEGDGKGLVLVVEDEQHIADLQSLYFRREGFSVRIESDGRNGLHAVRRLKPVVVVLDIGLPGMNGVDVCKALRDAGDWTPLLLVTARDDETDRVLGLELGADDYITKPFSPHELVARVKALLRRSRLTGAGAGIRNVGRTRIDVPARTVTADGIPVELTATEFNLLATLTDSPGTVRTRAQLLAHVWGHGDYNERVVDVYVAQLRAKLGAASPIRTHRGVGYSAVAER
ncbi:response regulator transcription factor [Streptomyces sp. GMY02]|uniref:response regulator transcription factor n=1 Tax=Streptomyces sp. GMY02 TaxID=1333528 RepID=UPI0020B89DF2|nr:response regulator transcription factor [Streptomyces sp. GMY02]